MKSPTKRGSAGLNQRATEYKLTEPSDKRTEGMINESNEGVTAYSSSLAEPNVPEIPLFSLDEAQVNSVVHHATASTIKDEIGKEFIDVAAVSSTNMPMQMIQLW